MKSAINLIVHRKKACIWALVFGIIFLSGAYLYLVNSTILHAVAGEEIRTELMTVTSSIAELEATAISMRNAIDINTATALGYREAKISKYIERRGVSQLDASRTIR